MRVPHIRISFYFLPPPFRPFPPLNSVVSSLCPHCRPVLRLTAVKNVALSKLFQSKNRAPPVECFFSTKRYIF
jgi:hypothetical protein